MSGATPTSGDSERAVSTDRVERIMARIGLASSAMMLVALVIGADVLLTRWVVPAVGRSREALDFDLNLVTSDGRPVGRGGGGPELTLTPGTFYRNRPHQTKRGLTTNAQGLRGPEIAAGHRRPRVIVTGGSTVFGKGVLDGQTFVAQMGARHPSWEVLNAGVVGYLSQQELTAVMLQWIDLQPDLIVAFNGWNDAYDHYWWLLFGRGAPHPGVNVNFLFMEDRLARQREVETSPWFALRAAGRATARASTILSALSPRNHEVATTVPGPHETRLRRALDLYVTNMIKLHDLARARGSRLLVAIQPEACQLLTTEDRQRLGQKSRGDFAPGDHYYEWFPDQYSRFRGLAADALRQHGVPVLDVTAGLPMGPGRPGAVPRPRSLDRLRPRDGGSNPGSARSGPPRRPGVRVTGGRRP
jgi:hypothetical protein